MRRRQCDKDPRRRRRRVAAAIAGFSSLAFVAAAAGRAACAASVAPHPGGFWKCAPLGHVKGAFDNEDPVGLAAHSHIATTCALHWSDGHGTTYCFATPPSFLEFENNPEILRKALAFWRLSHVRD